MYAAALSTFDNKDVKIDIDNDNQADDEDDKTANELVSYILQYLHSIQNADGSIPSTYSPLETTAEAVVALSLINKVDDDDYSYNQNSTLDGMLSTSYYDSLTGKFSYNYDYNITAYQTNYALVAYDRSTSGATSLFDFSDVNTVYYISFDGNGSSSTMKTQAVEIQNATDKSVTSADATLNANTLTKSGYSFVGWVDENGKSYTDKELINVSKDVKLYAVWQKLSSSVSSGADAMKTAINTNSDLEAMMRLDSKNAVTGTWSKNAATKKWNLFVDGKPFTGGFIIAMNPAAGTYARSGKFYFDKDGNMLTGWQQLIGDDGILHWYYFNPVQDNWYGACYLNTTTPDGYVVDKTGAWMDPNVVTQESIDKIVNESSEETSTTTTSGSSGSTTEETTKKTNKISVSVSVSGNTVSGSEEVTLSKNASAYDALKALAKKMGWSVSGSGSYIKGIGGEMEKSAGAYSGWTYSVNGTTPNKSSGSCKLSDGDSVDWTFVDGPSN